MEPSPGLIPCRLTEAENKIGVHLRDGDKRCAERIETGGYIYYEHFASNPPTGGVCWGECRVPISSPH
jgi:hypothetical protein